MGLSASQIGVLIAIHILLIGLFQINSGKIADRFNRKGLVIGGGLITSAFLFSIPLCANFFQLLALCVLGAIGGSISIPAISAISVDEGREYGMGSLIGIFTMALSIGICVGPLLGGGIADALGVGSVFYLSGLVGLFGIGLFAWFMR